MTALRRYVDGHLALDMRHERVRIVKVACAGFVLGGAEGRLKVLAPPGSVGQQEVNGDGNGDSDENRNGGRQIAVERLLGALVEVARLDGTMAGERT